VQQKISRPRKKADKLRKIHNKHIMICSPHTACLVNLLKQTGKGGACNTYVYTKNSNKILSESPHGNCTLIVENNVEKNCKKISCEELHWIELCHGAAEEWWRQAFEFHTNK